MGMQRNEDKGIGEEGQAGGEDVIFRHEDCGVSPQNKHTQTNVNTTRGAALLSAPVLPHDKPESPQGHKTITETPSIHIKTHTQGLDCMPRHHSVLCLQPK